MAVTSSTLCFYDQRSLGFQINTLPLAKEYPYNIQMDAKTQLDQVYFSFQICFCIVADLCIFIERNLIHMEYFMRINKKKYYEAKEQHDLT